MRKASVYLFVCLTLVALVPLAPFLFAGTETLTELRMRQTAMPRFTLEQAVLTALMRNADIQKARQDIERTKGLYIQMRAEILPKIEALYNVQNTDPHLGSISSGSSGGLSGVPTQYSLSLQASQVVFAGGRVISNIRAAAFTRDSSYFGFRNVVDTVISTVKQQFYQVLLNRELINVQESSVNLLKSQLQDQQNRFEAGTVPRFNVLQAQVALSNQYPLLIAAQNSYRISLLQLAKTLGLDFDPMRAGQQPLEAVGTLEFHPRHIPLDMAIEMAKERRPFLKQQKAVVLSNAAQVNVARSGYFPTFSVTAGEDFRSSPISENIDQVRSGYVFGGTGSWAIWDWGATYGAVKQANAVLEQSKITLDDANRQVELEVQQQDSNLRQSAELVKATEESVGQAQEALRLASARLSAGAGTQLEVLNSRVEVTQAESNRIQALFNYNVALAEFDRVTATEVVYSNELDDAHTRDKTRTDARPTPAPKPTPLQLNHAGNRPPIQTRTTTTTRTTRTTGSK
ncbi:MAG TPA: TolC family protein [Chthoniobacterales bacterium]|nr:TolC family protein [Chthoniobacterales bacterium]